ncbi:MAG: S8 family peptidase [Williamsia sp.]|nr:S8 family peptidase [Williamsia sp.]
MKKILLPMLVSAALATVTSPVAAQGTSVKELPKGWHLLDKETDGYYGLSLKKAYDFVKGKKTKTVIVAVIDSGIDTLHEDLKDMLWTNPREIPGNGIDDDGNGYIDDVHGWNFLGGKDGRNVKEDSYEGARMYHQLKKIYGSKTIDSTTLSPEQKDEYQTWLKVRAAVEGDATSNGMDVLMMQRALEISFEGDSILRQGIGKETYTGKDLDKYNAVSPIQQRAKAILLDMFKSNNIMEMSNKEFLSELKEQVEGEVRKKESANTPPKDYRGEIVKDNEEDINDRSYGNNDIMAGTPLHGTHVSGIIAAKRNNGKGIDGIADDVKIMAIRAVPDGDEHDKDIALAIRYAVDNGAKVINMSFGKSFSPHKDWIDDAVQYADSKGVLLVHAAGNDAKDVDSTDNFPNPTFKKLPGKATNWITVGASSDPLAEPGFKSYTASFSNYGKKEVNVFAPGTRIYSSLPGGNVYGIEQGTSMASPVVAGVAAFILSYYPNLSPKQVKWVIEKSSVVPPAKVKVPGSDKLVLLSDISTSGGLINAYQAIKLASTLKPEGQNLPTSTLKNRMN